jgi:hypothetical protein
VYNYIFLLPLYNDWVSCAKLIDNINFEMKKLDKKGEIIIINDFSDTKNSNFDVFSNIVKINILNLTKNIGSQKAISVGLKYLYQKRRDKMIVTILDSDGEDDVNKIPEMIKEAESNPDKVIVSSRTKRHENIVFKSLYFGHKIIAFLFSLNWISFGNYSSFSSDQLKKILINNNSWLAFSSSVVKNCKIKKLKAERKKRLHGVSKLSFFDLIQHSLRVNSVFIVNSFILSTIYILLLVGLINIGYSLFFYLVLAIVFYNFLLIITWFKNDQKNYFNSLDLIKN